MRLTLSPMEKEITETLAWNKGDETMIYARKCAKAHTAHSHIQQLPETYLSDPSLMPLIYARLKTILSSICTRTFFKFKCIKLRTNHRPVLKPIEGSRLLLNGAEVHLIKCRRCVTSEIVYTIWNHCQNDATWSTVVMVAKDHYFPAWCMRIWFEMFFYSRAISEPQGEHCVLARDVCTTKPHIYTPAAHFVGNCYVQPLHTSSLYIHANLQAASTHSS